MQSQDTANASLYCNPSTPVPTFPLRGGRGYAKVSFREDYGSDTRIALGARGDGRGWEFRAEPQPSVLAQRLSRRWFLRRRLESGRG